MPLELVSMCPQDHKTESLNIRDCGLADYDQILDLQKQLCALRMGGQICDTILIVEHYPVITLGANKPKNRLLLNEKQLTDKDIKIVSIRRGGGATAHNPGQLVIYPIINLTNRKLGITEYVRKLETIGIELLAQLGIESERKKGFPGLWTNEKKIASIGVRVSKFITHHGMAVNICNDLAIFDMMVPCGIDNVVMTSAAKQLNAEIDIEKAKTIMKNILIRHFEKTQGC